MTGSGNSRLLAFAASHGWAGFLILVLSVGVPASALWLGSGSLQVVSAQEPSKPEIDSRTRLVVDEGLELVKAKCLDCHTSRLILQNRGTREHWQGMLRWMEETQGLEPLGKAEQPILSYLARNYGIEERPQRRRPLSKELLPPR